MCIYTRIYAKPSPRYIKIAKTTYRSHIQTAASTPIAPFVWKEMRFAPGCTTAPKPKYCNFARIYTVNALIFLTKKKTLKAMLQLVWQGFFFMVLCRLKKKSWHRAVVEIPHKLHLKRNFCYRQHEPMWTFSISNSLRS